MMTPEEVQRIYDELNEIYSDAVEAGKVTMTIDTVVASRCLEALERMGAKT